MRLQRLKINGGINSSLGKNKIYKIILKSPQERSSFSSRLKIIYSA